MLLFYSPENRVYFKKHENRMGKGALAMRSRDLVAVLTQGHS